MRGEKRLNFSTGWIPCTVIWKIDSTIRLSLHILQWHVKKEITTENQAIISRRQYPDPGSNRDGLLQRCLRPSRLPIPPSGLMVVGLHGAKLRNFFYSLRVAGIILHGDSRGWFHRGIRGVHGGTGDFRRCSPEAGSRTIDGAQGVEGDGRKGRKGRIVSP